MTLRYFLGSKSAIDGGRKARMCGKGDNDLKPKIQRAVSWRPLKVVSVFHLVSKLLRHLDPSGGLLR